MGWKVIIAPSALADLENLVRYLAREISEAAAHVGYELIARVEGLATFPELGRVVPEFQRADLMVCRSDRIIERVRSEPQCIDIVRFWHGARGFPQGPTEEGI